MRLVFMGTPDFAVSTLGALREAGHEIACVYSQPPRQAGRGMKLRPSPVHAFAEAQAIEVRTPLSLKSPEEQHRFASLNADAAIVVAYGLLLQKAILDAPTHGCFNVHASLLPRWRGAAPLQRAIMAGDEETGVTIMRMEEGLDTGPMMKIVRTQIKPDMTVSDLHDVLAAAGAKAMVDVLAAPLGPGTPQPPEGITYAKKIDKSEARIDFTKSAVEVRNHIHGLSPFPGAWFEVNGIRIKVLRAILSTGYESPTQSSELAPPIGVAMDDQLAFACASGTIRFTELQREGKGPMKAEEFLRGFPVSAGTRAN